MNLILFESKDMKLEISNSLEKDFLKRWKCSRHDKNIYTKFTFLKF